MWSSFTITSPAAPAVVRDRLAAALTTAAPGWLSGHSTLRGEVWNDGFEVTRNLSLTEPALPIIAIGRFTPAGRGTAVLVATRPMCWVVLVLCTWSAFWVRLLWQRLVSDPLPGGIQWGEIVVLVGFLAFAWGLVFVVCVVEERQCQQALSRLVGPAEADVAPDRQGE